MHCDSETRVFAWTVDVPLHIMMNPWLRTRSDTLFCGGLERSEVAKRSGGQRVGQACEILSHLGEPRAAFAPPLVHVDRPVKFELDGVQSAGRVAVMLGDETTGIRLVASDRITKLPHGFLDHVGKQGRATGAVAV